MKKVLFVSQDPGGTNVLIPIIRILGGRCFVSVLAKDNATRIYKDRGIPYSDIRDLTYGVEENDLKCLLENYSPDLLVTGTGASDDFERKMWLVAKELGIKTIAILDSWCNYGLRFSKYTFNELDKYELDREIMYLPDVVLTMDELSKDGLIKDGLPADIIRIIGHPFLQMQKEVYSTVSEKVISDYKQQLTGSSKKKLIVFGSDNLSDTFLPSSKEYWGYDEKSIFECVFDSICKTCVNTNEYVVVIRPHPKEKTGNWSEILNRICGGKVDVFIDDYSKDEIIICAADIVVGMWSMFLVEACLANKRVISVQIGLKRYASFILTDSNAITPIVDQEELTRQFDRFFSGDDDIGKVKWSVDDNSINNALQYII